jgi:hypothetical protein
LAGVFYYIHDKRKGEYHLKNALKLDAEYLIIIEELYPTVYEQKKVQEIIKLHKNPSL